MYAMVGIALAAIPADMWLNADEYLVEMEDAFYRVGKSDAWYIAPGMGEYLIVPYLGKAWGFVYEVVVNFAVINVCLVRVTGNDGS
jgi:hypothetical protein